MKNEILSQKKNPLLKREEVWFSYEHPGKATPDRAEAVKGAARLLKTREELVIIDKIFSEKGKAESKVKALLYRDKKDIPEFKLRMTERRKEAKKAPKEEQKAPPKEETKPGEKPHEEAKEEEKTEGEEKKE